MTDRQLLEDAAKAAGITGWQSKHGYWNMKDIDGSDVVCCTGWANFNPDTGKAQTPTFSDAVAELNWNPLTDDGDALRLAVKLMEFEPYRGKGCAPFFSNNAEATRRAITRAAAEIGRAMP